MPSPIYLVASGDLRLSANQVCWPAQAQVEAKVIAAINALGGSVVRAHPVDETKQHGFIDSQKMGMEVFRGIPLDAPVVVVEAVWQYSHHVLAGLMSHRGPILTIANWSGQWPGLVGLLNLNASLRKAGVVYSSLWSESFDDEFFLGGLERWLEHCEQAGREQPRLPRALPGWALEHDQSHVHPDQSDPSNPSDQLGRKVAQELMRDKAIIGVFDEGCMGMYNAIIPDELLHATGVFKERLSQSALFARMQTVSEEEARGAYDWLLKRGMRFDLPHPQPPPHQSGEGALTLTENQILLQCKMYIAAVRIGDEFGCDAIGIQYQQGLKDTCPASDLAEGMLNNPDRPPVFPPHPSGGEGRRSRRTEMSEANREAGGEGVSELFQGRALTHFNEVDECAGLDGLITDRIWSAMGLDPSNTLHDLRYGEEYNGQFVWVLLISGAAPASHFIGGYAGAFGDRQPPMYFPLGGSTMRGVSKPGEVVWSRVFVAEGRLHADLGMLDVIELPPEETQRRWQMTTPQWPIMHAVIRGVTRDQMMARHMSNHIQVAYGGVEAMRAKAAAFAELGLEVSICGNAQ